MSDMTPQEREALRLYEAFNNLLLNHDYLKHPNTPAYRRVGFLARTVEALTDELMKRPVDWADCDTLDAHLESATIRLRSM